MYQSHWGLRESPFRNCLDPRSFYQSPTHEEALARLHFLVEENRRLGILMGPAGSGKSLLLEVFADEVRRRGRSVAKLNLVGMEPAEGPLVAGVSMGEPARTVGICRRGMAGTGGSAHRIALSADRPGRAPGRRRSGRPRRAAAPGAIGQVGLLAGVAADVDPGRPARGDGRLGDPLLDLAELRIDVQPWEPGDTEGFLARTRSPMRAARRRSSSNRPSRGCTSSRAASPGTSGG